MRAPVDERELLERARRLAGQTVGEIARAVGRPLPADARRAKGFIGMVVEQALGATAASRAVPDFPALGIELKTIPIDARGVPRESTFVCAIALRDVAEVEWAESRVRGKLRRVLWVPVEDASRGHLAERRFGAALRWDLRGDDERMLEGDWMELTGLIAAGRIEEVTGHLGRALQVRPKAAHGGVRARGVDGDGAPAAEQPRGFYLRAGFTAQIFSNAGLLPPCVSGPARVV